MSKLFAFDMDGTILDSKNKIKQATVNALILAKEKGHKAIIATGRPYIDSIRDLGMAKDYIDYLVCNNGTYFIKPDGKDVEYLGEVPIKLFKQVVKVGKQHNCFFAVHGSKEAQRVYLGENGFNDVDWDSSEFKEFKKFKDNFVSIDYVTEWIKNQHISQMSLRSDSKTIKKIKNQFKKYSDIIDIHIANDIYLDINSKDISKLIGVKRVANYLGYSLKDVIAFGDSGNDLQMLKGVGLGICMGNGNALAKEAADIVIDSNDSDAIGKKILEIINNE